MLASVEQFGSDYGPIQEKLRYGIENKFITREEVDFDNRRAEVFESLRTVNYGYDELPLIVGLVDKAHEKGYIKESEL